MAQGEFDGWYKILDLDIYADEEVEGYILVWNDDVDYDFKRVLTNNQGSFDIIENNSNKYVEYIEVDENTQKIEIYVNNNNATFSSLAISYFPLQYLDLSNKYFSNSSFLLEYMPDLTDIIFPQSLDYINTLSLVDLGLTGELDLSWVEEKFDALFLKDLDITSLKFNENADEILTTLVLDKLNNIEGVLDLTQFVTIGQILEITNMPNIEEILFYENINSLLSNLYIFNTGINTDLDVSMFDNFIVGSVYYIYNNKRAGEIIFPNNFGNGEFWGIKLHNNGTLAGTPSIPSSSILNLFTKGMFDYEYGYFIIDISFMGWDATEVNQALQITDNNSSPGYEDRLLYIQGNTAPTGAGITAKNSLINKGWTVLTD